MVHTLLHAGEYCTVINKQQDTEDMREKAEERTEPVGRRLSTSTDDDDDDDDDDDEDEDPLT